MPHIGRFLGTAVIAALFSGSAVAQDIDAAQPNLAAPRHLVPHRAKVALNIRRNVVPVSARLGAGPVAADEPAAIMPVSASGADAQVAVRP